MKHSKTILCVLLCLLLLVGSIPVFAADNNEENTPKEEVVYVNLNGDGSVKDITVVNAFDLDSDGKIIDYGAYESVRNMTTTDKIQYSGNKPESADKGSGCNRKYDRSGSDRCKCAYCRCKH